MLSKSSNSGVKLWRNKNIPAKNKKNKLFINKFNWEGINYLSEKNDWKKNLRNKISITLNVFYAKIYLVSFKT